jgi:murein DD-endopeptidase MepM/ murein hydrolase activator NlpD
MIAVKHESTTTGRSGTRAAGAVLALASCLLATACQVGSHRSAAAVQPLQAPAAMFDTLSGRVKTGESFNTIVRGLALPSEDAQCLLGAIKGNFRFKLYAGQAYKCVRRIGSRGPVLEAFLLEDRYSDRRHILSRPADPQTAGLADNAAGIAAANAPALPVGPSAAAPAARTAPSVAGLPASPGAAAAPGALAYSVSDIPVRTDTVAVNGVLSNNLYDAFVSLGETGSLIQQVTKIFAWDLDFFRDPRVGDAFSLLVEKKHGEDGSFRGYGRVLSAKYVNRGREFYGILYRDSYFDQDGRSLEKMLMKAPLNYVRVTSGFTSARLHPVLGITRPHWGIDYAGPLNTKILAAGDGVVEYAKWVNGYGKTMKIRHNGVYNTYYGHLNGFAAGMSAGRRVRQGDVVAYMGRTGLASGVHLDYRVEFQGRYINPASLKMEAKAGVAKAEWQSFCAYRDVLLTRMASPAFNNFASASRSSDPSVKAF